MIPTTNSPEEPALVKRQVGKQLSISQRHLENLMRARAIEYFKIGKSVRFSPEAVRRFKESRTVRAVA